MSKNNNSSTNKLMLLGCTIFFLVIAVATYFEFHKIKELQYRIMNVEKIESNILSNNQYGFPNMSENALRAEVYSAAQEASESFVNYTGELLETFGVMLTILTSIICIFFPYLINKNEEKWMEQRLEKSQRDIEEQKKQIETMQIRRKEQMNKYNDLLKTTNMFADRMRQLSIKKTNDISKRLEYQIDYDKLKNAEENEKLSIMESMKESDIADSKVYYELGKLYSQINDDTKACASFKKAIDNDIEFVDAYLGWADILVRQNNLREAWEKREKAIFYNKNETKTKDLQKDQDEIVLLLSSTSSSLEHKKKIRVENVVFNMILVNGGAFEMGKTLNQDDIDLPQKNHQHKVLLDSYYIGETVVTQKLWHAIMGSNPSNNMGENLPVENISWQEANAFIVALNEYPEIKNKKIEFSLPTSAQWEYAARGGHEHDKNNYHYSGSNDIEDVAWYEKNSEKRTHPVKEKGHPNRLGLYDMSGNVFEWCQDYWKGYTYYDDENWFNPCCEQDYGLGRICRGGGWGSSKESCRVTSVVNGHKSSAIGFRLVINTNTPISR